MRGSVMELVIIFIILGIVLVGMLFGLKVYNKFTESDAWSDTDAGQAAKSGASGAIDTMNYGFAFLLGGLLISMIVSALYIKTNPVFFILSLILLIFVVMVSGPLANTFMGVANDNSFSSEVATLDVSTYIIGNLPLIAVVGGFLIMIALYAKPRGGEI